MSQCCTIRLKSYNITKAIELSCIASIDSYHDNIVHRHHITKACVRNAFTDLQTRPRLILFSWEVSSILRLSLCYECIGLAEADVSQRCFMMKLSSQSILCHWYKEAADHMSSLRRRLMMPDFDIIYQFLNRTNYQCDCTICMCLNKCTFLHSQWNMFIGNQICQAETNNMQHHIRLFVHNTISLSSLCTLIWRHWSYKMPVGYILSSVWVRLSIFFQLSTIQYMGMCVFSLPISLVMIEGIYIWSYSLGATARSYRRQDGADAAARFEKFLPTRASLRPPISLKFATE